MMQLLLVVAIVVSALLSMALSCRTPETVVQMAQEAGKGEVCIVFLLLIEY